MSSRASASPYARALLDVVKDGNPEPVEQQLTAFAALVAGTPDLQKALGNPAIPAAAKRRIVEQVAHQTGITGPLARLLMLLADRDDLALIGELATAFRERVLEYRQIVRAEVVTAEPMTPERATQFEQRLSKATGKRVTMVTRVDPSLIGGAVARVGSLVYDGSVATQLEKLRERLDKAR
jgi:F-type H+-transporting ATPase subunit delta